MTRLLPNPHEPVEVSCTWFVRLSFDPWAGKAHPSLICVSLQLCPSIFHHVVALADCFASCSSAALCKDHAVIALLAVNTDATHASVAVRLVVAGRGRRLLLLILCLKVLLLLCVSSGLRMDDASQTAQIQIPSRRGAGSGGHLRRRVRSGVARNGIWVAGCECALVPRATLLGGAATYSRAGCEVAHAVASVRGGRSERGAKGKRVAVRSSLKRHEGGWQAWAREGWSCLSSGRGGPSRVRVRMDGSRCRCALVGQHPVVRAVVLGLCVGRAGRLARLIASA